MRIHNLYVDDDGETHWRDIEVEWVESRNFSKMSARLPATGIIFRQTTGDYDLFFLFARSSQYSPDKGDRRMVSHAQLEQNIRTGAPAGEDPHLGNITPRIKAVRDQLNTAIQRRGYTGGNMVHHSDEGVRPFVEDVDLPVFAVVPGATQAFGLEDIGYLRQFITEHVRGEYAPVLHPGWMKQLVFHPSGDIAAAAHHAIRHGALLSEIKKTVPRR